MRDAGITCPACRRGRALRRFTPGRSRPPMMARSYAGDAMNDCHPQSMMTRTKASFIDLLRKTFKGSTRARFVSVEPSSEAQHLSRRQYGCADPTPLLEMRSVTMCGATSTADAYGRPMGLPGG